MSRGSNSSALRHFNECVVISTLRKQGSATKPELAKLVGLTLPALTRIIDDLEVRELLKSTGRKTQGVGQPSNIYQINPESLYSIGVHFDREIINFMLANFAGKPLALSSIEYSNIDPATTVDIICKETQKLFAKLTSSQAKKFVGVGIAMPWFLGSWAEMEETSKQWMAFDLATALEEKLPHKIFYENNCTAAAAAELHFGKTIGANNILYIYIGKFVGGGLVLNGDLERGVFSNAASLTTMPVPPSSLYTNIDSQDFTTLVDRASIGSLIKYLNSYNIKINNIAQLNTIIDDNRLLVHEWMLDCAESLIYAIHSSISLLDLEKVIIDSDLPRHLLTELIDIVKRKLEKTKQVNLFLPEIQQGSLGTNAKVIGGAILPLYTHFAPDKTIILKGGIPHRDKFANN